jgi:uncharacterized membrane protein
MNPFRQTTLSKWGWQLARLMRKLWLRATLISLLAVGAALVSLVVSPYLPSDISAKIGADAVDRILNIIATSMLAVTTFSLSATVAAYAAATANVTPRATKLLIEDRTTLNVLATFVGSFLFSVVAIITLAMGAYGDRGRAILFAVTVLVIILIVVTLLRWIDYLLRLGRVGETTEEVERATAAAMRRRMELPNLGGTPWNDPEALPVNAQPVNVNSIGYVQHIDVGAIAKCADELGARVYLAALPGTFVDTNRPVAWIAGAKGSLDPARIASQFTVAAERSFDQDPRFGLCVLAEIASRALSPGLNDPGTAIDVVGRGIRILALLAEPNEDSAEPPFARVYVPSIQVSDLLDDIFTPIARDGAANAEVQIRLQKAFAALARIDNRDLRDGARLQSQLALARARQAIASKYDLDRIEAAAELVLANQTGKRKARRAKGRGD